MNNQQMFFPKSIATPFKSKKVSREYRTIKAMIGIYCREVHGRQISICTNCRELLDYSEKRLRLCRHFRNKPPCRDCLTPCFAEPQKNLIREIMKFSGPRLIFHHPWLASRHFWIKHFETQSIFSFFQNPHGGNNLPE